MSKNVLTVNFIIQILKNKHTFNKKYKKLKKLSSLSERTQLSQFFILFEESVFNFQYLNDKMHNYVKQNIIVHFIIQKLKSKHTFLKKYKKLRKLNPLNLTEREETKSRYFPPMPHLKTKQKHFQLHSSSLISLQKIFYSTAYLARSMR